MTTPIYHITHVTNLPSIVAVGGLRCDRAMASAAIPPTSIAHQHIKESRADRQVVKGPGGTLADFVPFYFAPRSPMLYAIYKGAVAGYSGGQEEVVHMVASAESVNSSGIPFVFTDGHADMGFSQQFDDLAHLDAVDWDVMQRRWWNDTLTDPDRQRRRQAEFLAHAFVPIELVVEIGVHNPSTAAVATAALGSFADDIPITVRPHWYY